MIKGSQTHHVLGFFVRLFGWKPKRKPEIQVIQGKCPNFIPKRWRSRFFHPLDFGSRELTIPKRSRLESPEILISTPFFSAADFQVLNPLEFVPDPKKGISKKKDVQIPKQKSRPKNWSPPNTFNYQDLQMESSVMCFLV